MADAIRKTWPFLGSLLTALAAVALYAFLGGAQAGELKARIVQTEKRLDAIEAQIAPALETIKRSQQDQRVLIERMLAEQRILHKGQLDGAK